MKIPKWFKSNKKEYKEDDIFIDVRQEKDKYSDTFKLSEYAELITRFDEYQKNKFFNLNNENIKNEVKIEINHVANDSDILNELTDLGVDLTIDHMTCDGMTVNMIYTKGLIIERMIKSSYVSQQYRQRHIYYFIDKYGISAIITNGNVDIKRKGTNNKRIIINNEYMTKDMIKILEETGFIFGSTVNNNMQFLEVPSYMRIYKSDVTPSRRMFIIENELGEVILKVDADCRLIFTLKGQLHEESIEDINDTNYEDEIEFKPLDVSLYLNDSQNTLASAKIQTKELLEAIIYISNKEHVIDFDIEQKTIRINTKTQNWNIEKRSSYEMCSFNFIKRGIKLFSINVDMCDKILTLMAESTIVTYINQDEDNVIKKSPIVAYREESSKKIFNAVSIYIKHDKQNRIFIKSKKFEGKELLNKGIEDFVEEELPNYREKPYLYWL